VTERQLQVAQVEEPSNPQLPHQSLKPLPAKVSAEVYLNVQYEAKGQYVLSLLRNHDSSEQSFLREMDIP
jgi:hypothetical protein